MDGVTQATLGRLQLAMSFRICPVQFDPEQVFDDLFTWLVYSAAWQPLEDGQVRGEDTPQQM